ncbi:MAG: hypothetical protein P4N59_22520 [Negativicutes bacterium]|nr:hypothetical protein [Negativicutes bacterium]
MKKLLLLTFLLLFAFQAVSFAAISGSKSAPMPAPKAPVTQMAPSAAPSTAPATGYKPSAPASSYSDTAPKSTLPQATQQPASGGFMRNLGMIGGGMLLGGLLGNMFGNESSGMLASLVGLLFNIILLVGIFLAGRYAWNKFKKSREETNRRN